MAIKDYTKTIELNPNDPNAYCNRCNIYNILGHYTQAVKDCTKAIKLDPKFAEAYVNRSNAYAHLGQYSNVIKDCSKAIKLNPKIAMAYNNRGLAYLFLYMKYKGCSDLKTACTLGVCEGLESVIKQGYCLQ